MGCLDGHGRRRRLFPPTSWTIVLRARSGEANERKEAVGQLMERYWKPVYSYLRRKGKTDASAKDLTQAFIQKVVLERRLIERADRARGRFRSFLLTALDHYVTSVRRAEGSGIRMPEGGILSLDEPESLGVLEPVTPNNPEDAFTYGWAVALLDKVIAEVQAQCRANGEAVYWEVFSERILRPSLDSTESPPLPDICKRHGLPSTSKASNVLLTVKRRFRAALRREIRQHVNSDEEIDDEIRDLIGILSRGDARK